MRRFTAFAAPFLILNFILMLPLYLFTSPHPDFLPFFPEAHPFGDYDLSWQSVREYLKAMFLRRHNSDIFRLSTEVIACFFILHLKPQKLSSGFWACVCAFPVCFLYMLTFYHYAVLGLFSRNPVLSEDLYLARSALSWLNSAYGLGNPLIYATLASLFLCLWGMISFLMYLHQQSSPARINASRAAFLALFSYGLFCHLWFGISRNDPVMQLRSKIFKNNILESYRMLAGIRENPQSALLRHELFSWYAYKIPDPCPHVFVFLIESYGRVLSGSDEFREDFGKITRNAEARFSSAGFQARSGLIRSPVFGGASWFASSTLLSGVTLKTYADYDYFNRHIGVVPHLVGYFQLQNYRTLVVNPGNSDMSLPSDHFGFDMQLNRWDLNYRGYSYGWGHVPDQYSLGVAMEKVRAQESPVFMLFKGVSTHTPWSMIPALSADYRELNNEEFSGLTFSSMQKGYIASVSYFWNLLTDLGDSLTQDTVIIVLGDHQPPFLPMTDRQQFEVPIHILSKNPDHLQKAETFGLREGLFPHQKDSKLQHEDFFRIVISVVASGASVQTSLPSGDKPGSAVF